MIDKINNIVKQILKEATGDSTDSRGSYVTPLRVGKRIFDKSQLGAYTESVSKYYSQQLATDRKAAKNRLKNFDVFVAEAPMMPTVGRVVGPILGPRGKMPIPVPPQAPIDNIIERERRVVILRSRDKPFVHCIIGKEKMDDEKIAQNIESVINNLTSATKRGFGNIKSIYLKLTMGDAVQLF